MNKYKKYRNELLRRPGKNVIIVERDKEEHKRLGVRIK